MVVGTVGSHFSKLQFSKHISHSNVFGKATPTIFRYFQLLSLTGSWFSAVQMADMAGFSTKVKATVKVCRWVPPTACAQWKWTKQRLMVVHILALATYAVLTFRPVESGDMYLHKVIVAHQQFSCNAAGHSAYSFCHVG